MDSEPNKNNDLLQDIEELIEEHLISYEEVVIDQYNDQTNTIKPLPPTWLLETQGYNELCPGEFIQQELTTSMVVPEDFLNNLSVTEETPKKSDYVEDSSQLDEYFITSFSEQPKSEKRPLKIRPSPQQLDELHLVNKNLLHVSKLNGQAVGINLAMLVAARRHLWLSQTLTGTKHRCWLPRLHQGTLFVLWWTRRSSALTACGNPQRSWCACFLSDHPKCANQRQTGVLGSSSLKNQHSQLRLLQEVLFRTYNRFCCPA
ncbi:UNVERIFIED_CONTAM: hypothetical protein FKN15_035966 [Acipenser sinensis]